MAGSFRGSRQGAVIIGRDDLLVRISHAEAVLRGVGDVPKDMVVVEGVGTTDSGGALSHGG